MSLQKFITEGGLSIPSGKELELGSISLDDVKNAVDAQSATALLTENAIVNYVATQLTAEDLDITVDGGSAFAIDLDSETLEFTSGDGMDISTTGSAITFTVETASATNPGMVELATNDETNTGTDDARAVTPAGLTAWTGDTALVTLGTIATGTWQGTAVARTYIAADAIDGTKIDDNVIDSEHYVAGSIDNEHMAANSVDSDQYVDGSIDLIHMSANSVDSDQYVDGSIDNAHLADDAVGADELAPDAVVNASVAAGAAIDLDKLDWTSATGTAIEDFAQDDYVMVYDLSETAIVKMTMDSLEDSVFGNVSGDILIAAGGAATIQANSVALATDTTGDYVADVTAGTGLTSTGATTGENISHSLSVDAIQTQITSLGTITTGVWNSTQIANAYLANDSVTVVAGSGLSGGGEVDLGSSVTIDLDLSEATAGIADNAADTFLFIDATDSSTKQESLADLVAGMDGTGLTAASGSLSVDASQSQITTLAGATAIGTSGAMTTFAGTVNVDEAVTFDTTLGVTGIATFTAQSVHTGGIDCNGDIAIEGNAITGTADEMIISADGDEYSVSGGSPNTLSLNASGGIFTDDAVDMDSTLNVEGLVTMQAAATVGTTLGVTGVGTFTAQSVHSGGLESGGNIVSDTNSTDDLGSSSRRWANVYSDDANLEHSKKSSFEVSSMDGTSADTIFTFTEASYNTVKVTARTSDGSDFTAKEVLLVSNGSTINFVEYGTVSTGTELTMTFSASTVGGTTTVKCLGAAMNSMKGSYELLA